MTHYIRQNYKIMATIIQCIKDRIRNSDTLIMPLIISYACYIELAIQACWMNVSLSGDMDVLNKSDLSQPSKTLIYLNISVTHSYNINYNMMII